MQFGSALPWFSLTWLVLVGGAVGLAPPDAATRTTLLDAVTARRGEPPSAAAERFHRHGVVVLPDAVPEPLLARAIDSTRANFAEYLAAADRLGLSDANVAFEFAEIAHRSRGR